MIDKFLGEKIAKPYAAAIFDLAKSTETVTIIKNDIELLIQFFEKNSKYNTILKPFLNNPFYSKNTKKILLKKIITPLNLNQNTILLLMILIERSRINLFYAISQNILKYINDYKNKIKVVITSSYCLDSYDLHFLRIYLANITQYIVELSIESNENLLGGMVIIFDETQIIDLSLIKQYKKLEKNIIEKI